MSVNRITPQEFAITQTIVGSTAANLDYFGSAIAMSDQCMAVGVPLHDGAGTDWGAVFVYEKIAGVWTEVDILTVPASLKDQVYFGQSVAVGNDVIAVGAYGDGVGTTIPYGAVYIYRRIAGTWTLTHTLTRPTGTPDNGDRFGLSIDITPDGSRLIVGMPPNVSGRKFPAYVFHYDAGTDAWDFFEIDPPDNSNDDGNGLSVAISPNGIVAVTGSPGDDDTANNSGSLNAFVWDSGLGLWVHAHKFVASDPASGARLGDAVGCSNNFVAGAAPSRGDPIASSGVVYVYQLSTGTQVARITTRVPTLAAHEMGLPATNGTGTRLLKFGDSGELVVECVKDPSPVSNAGTFRVFVPDPAGWSTGFTEHCYTQIPNNVSNQYFGTVAIYGTEMMVGHCRGNGAVAGSGVVYYIDTLPWTLPEEGSGYIMRGWRPGTSDYEYWTATGSPNADNPSGQPIVDITIQSRKL